MKILVTGATGYIGGRLVPLLLDHDHDVRVLVRDPKRIIGRVWDKNVEIAVGDMTDPNSLESALEGIEIAYYLVHSMYTGVDFVKQDRKAIHNFIIAGKNLKHVIYLGGLFPESADPSNISKHLKSRAEVGSILLSSLPATEFRAGPIIGSGSASFEMVRYLTQRLPIMIAPNWISNEVQPIAIRDILSYLLQAVDRDPMGIVEVGSDRLTFKQMMAVFAEVRGLTKRIIFEVKPFLPPKIITKWFGFFTPIPDSLAIPLVEGISNPVLADVKKAQALFPEIKPIPYRLAVELALERIQHEMVLTRWSGAIGAIGDHPTYELVDREGLIREVRTLYTESKPETVFKNFSSIGGKRGWLVWKWAWEIRGLIDKIVGGPGLRRGRRHPTELLPGEALDFWRVEEIESPGLLRLRAEMKVPGRAWMQWEAIPEKSGTRLVQTAMFAPKGASGALYWYCLYPIHSKIFSDLVQAIAKKEKK